MAEKFLEVINFNFDEVKTRCAFLNSIKDVFAEDVHYNSNCLRNYFRKYDWKLHTFLQRNEKANESIVVTDNCKNVFSYLDFGTSGYSVSFI